MVNKDVIKTLYRQYARPPKSPDELDIGLLFDTAIDNHGIFIDEDALYIGSVDPSSPFSTIPLRNINALVNFETQLAVVLHSAIIFLHKEKPEVNIHLKLQDEPDSVWQRVRNAFKS